MTTVLEERQESFCRNYLIDFNATKAALAAGYAKRSAGQQACRLLKNDKIKARLAELIGERNERLQVNADWVLKMAVMHASFDLTDLIDEQGNVMPPSEWPPGAGMVIAGMDVNELVMEGAPPALIKKIKRTDPLKALEMVGRHVDIQAFKDKVEHEVTENAASRLLTGRERAREAIKGVGNESNES